MKPIQILLISGILLIITALLLRYRGRSRIKILILATSFMLIGLVLRPNISSALAHKLGVGRGTDLIFYIQSLLMIWLIIYLFGKVKILEERIVHLIRQEAIKNIRINENERGETDV